MDAFSLRYLCLTIGLCLLVSCSASSDENILGEVNNLSKHVRAPVEEVRIVDRSGWFAQPPKVAPTPLEPKPQPYAIISHTNSPSCYFRLQCILNVLTIQSYHKHSKGLNLNDIAYNYLVGGDGRVYEGRGWTIEGEHTVGYNNKSFGIALIGNFERKRPTDGQLRALEGLLQLGVYENILSKDYKLIGQRQVENTTSPGEKAFDIIKTWDHWSAQP